MKDVKLIALEAENFKRLKAVNIDLDNDVTVLKGNNAQVRRRKEKDEAGKKYSDLDSQYKDMSKQIEALQKSKSDAIAGVSMPIEGIGITSDGVTFNGIPISQASSAEQLKISIAMAAIANPELKMACIKDGSLLDDNSMAAIQKIAEEQGIQILIERVGTGGVGLLIEDGEVIEG